MKDKNNLEPSDYIQQSVNNFILSNSDRLNYGGIKNIIFNDDVEELHIHYKDKEYVFDLEKALSLLCKELEDE